MKYNVTHRKANITEKATLRLLFLSMGYEKDGFAVFVRWIRTHERINAAYAFATYDVSANAEIM